MSRSRDGVAAAGVAAVACAACCAGPIIGFLGALGLGSVIGAALFGAVGLAVVLIGGLLWRRRTSRRAQVCGVAPGQTVTVAAPVARRPGTDARPTT